MYYEFEDWSDEKKSNPVMLTQSSMKVLLDNLFLQV